jgi:drug/metabolite transporter (DMT)-like permease
LAASQPGFTILDPLWASLLGAFLFGEHLRDRRLGAVLEALALTVIVAGVAALSHSYLIADEDGPPSGERLGCRPEDHREQVRL